MRKLFNMMKLDEKDNGVTAFAKGGLSGTIGFSAVMIPLLSTIILIGRCVTNKEELKKFEEEIGAK